MEKTRQHTVIMKCVSVLVVLGLVCGLARAAGDNAAAIKTLKAVAAPIVATEQLLGGPPLNMTEQPRAPTSGQCPKGCDGRGVCKGGKCLCFTGFIGTGCQEKNYQGYALAFENSGYVQTLPLGSHKSFTVEAWVRLARVPESKDKPMVIFGSGSRMSLSVISNGRLSFHVQGNLPPTVVFDDAAGHLKPFEWYHVAVSYSMRHAGRTGTGSSSLYVNGKWVQTLGYSVDVGSTKRVDVAGGKIGEHFHGVIDELRVFGRALSPKELSHHHAGRLTGSEPGVLANFRFDEGWGTSVLDHLAEKKERHNALLVGRAEYVKSYAPFEICNLGCSNHGMCLVTQDSNGAEQMVCKCDQGFDGKTCETQVCPGEIPCNQPNGYCQRTIMQDTPHWKAPKLPPMFMHQGNDTRDELMQYKGTEETGVKKALEDAVELVKKAEWAAAHHKAWKCVCKPLYAGDACDKRKCPADCSQHGSCTKEGKCLCDEGWEGTTCNRKLCPNDCSDHGQCVDGQCVCDAGFTGNDCGILNQCPKGCSGHGRCVMAECQCDAAYTGDDCSWAASCYNFCSGRGSCVDDACVCDKLYTGIDCSEPRCPNDCGGRGDCIRGICMCEPGFEGAACETDVIWPMRCSTQRNGFTSSNSCKRGIEALEVVPQAAQVMQVKFEKEALKPTGAYQVFAPADKN